MTTSGSMMCVRCLRKYGSKEMMSRPVATIVVVFNGESLCLEHHAEIDRPLFPNDTLNDSDQFRSPDMTDLHTRLQDQAETLHSMARSQGVAPDRSQHLHSKREGVLLALDNMRLYS